MDNLLARRFSGDETATFGATEFALRQALEEARQIAAQSRLLALNAAIEAAAGGEADAAGRALAEAERMVGSAELLLEQIASASALAGPL